MTTKSMLMSGAAALRDRHEVEPKHFSNDEIGRYWRGVMFGWDEARELRFTGLSPRIRTGDPIDLVDEAIHESSSIWLVKWGHDRIYENGRLVSYPEPDCDA